MVLNRGVKPLSQLIPAQIADESRKQLQLLALANDYLRRVYGVKAVVQDKIMKQAKVAVNRHTLSYWRNKSERAIGAHNYRMNALCMFWGLSFEEMLEIGREEKASREGM